MQISNASLGVGSAVLGLLLFYYSSTLPPIPGQTYGADTFPRLISIGFMISGAVAIALHLRKSTSKAATVMYSRKSVAQIGGLGVGILAFTYFADVVGYLIACTVLLAGVMLAQRTRWWAAILAAILIALGTYVIFVYALRVPLPQFRLEM